MVVQQLGLHPQSTDNHKLQDPYYEEEEEEEDTLSLCDLPLTSSSDSSWDECSSNKGDQNSSFGDDEGLFEFFNEDFTESTYPTADKIIFCGKVIGSKEEEEEETRIMDREAQSQEFSKGGLFHKQRTTSSINKVSSSKWYVFEFGMGKYSMEMEQRNIKKRQSKRGPATMFQIVEKGESIKGKERRRSGKGLWGLLRFLGFKKNYKAQ